MASPIRRLLPLAALLFAAATGCSTTGTSGGSADAGTKPAAGQIPTGAGPQHRYTVQPQPAAGTCYYRHIGGQPLPDPACTPGALNPDVTPATITTTICRKGGYTGGIRPPANITDKEKHLNAASYGYTDSLHDAEYDHLISLQLGGDPNDPRNLWIGPPSPGHKPGTGPNNPKDAVETHLHTAICKGTITLTAAQHAITTNWTTAESTLGISR